MPLVNIRTLLRDPKKVFNLLEEMIEKPGAEPLVLTRNGVPVAMLSPVGADDAAGAAMSVLPEWTERRARAAEARQEGRTIPAETVDAPAPAVATADDVIEDVALLFGVDVADDLGAEVVDSLREASEPAVAAVADAEKSRGTSREEVAGSVRALSLTLFKSFLQTSFRARLATLGGVEPVGIAGSLHSGALAHRVMAETVIHDAAERVGELNHDVATRTPAGGLTLLSYELFVKGMTLGGQAWPYGPDADPVRDQSQQA